MADQTKSRTSPGRASADALANRRDKLVREQLDKERAASDAKTAKLRALRLAKEAADKDAQQGLEVEKHDVKTSAERRTRKQVFRF